MQTVIPQTRTAWIMLLLSFSLISMPFLAYQPLPTRRSFGATTSHTSIYAYPPRNDEIIDAEIVEDGDEYSHSSNRKNFDSKDRRKEFLVPVLPQLDGIMKFVKDAANTVGEGISKIFLRGDEEDEDDKQNFARGNGRVFDRKGIIRAENFDFPLTRLFGGAASGLFGLVANAASDLFAESEKDVITVQKKALDLMKMDQVCSDVFGKQLTFSAPYESSVSSMNINGISKREIFLRFEVSGTYRLGQATVRAYFGPDKIARIGKLQVITDRNEVFNLDGKGDPYDAEIIYQ